MSSKDSSSNLANIVRDLVKNKSTDETLFSLSDISTVRSWNYELPTLTEKGRFTRRQQWNSSTEFRELFFSKFPIFKSINLADIALMGGAVFDILHCREDSISDLDLFLCGDQYDPSSSSSSEDVEEKILKRVEQFIDDVTRYLEKLARDSNAETESYARQARRSPQSRELLPLSHYVNQLKATRNGPVLTLDIPTVRVPIQLVLAPHSSIHQLFRRVDLDCTAIAFYREQVVFNAISRFCYENSCTIVGNVRNFSYETRLAKYFSKGVDIILPALNISAIPRKNLRFGISEVVDLSYLGIVYSEIIGNKLIVQSLMPITPLENESEQSSSLSKRKREDKEDENQNDAASSSSGLKKRRVSVVSRRFDRSYNTSFDSYRPRWGFGGRSGFSNKALKADGVIIHENIIHLLHNLPEKFQFYGEGKFVKDVLLPLPRLTDRMITNTFETVRNQLHSFSSGQFDIQVLEKYFSVKMASTIVQEILYLPLKQREDERQEEQEQPQLKALFTLFDEEYEVLLKNYFAQLIESQIAETHQKLSELREDFQRDPKKYQIVTDLTFSAGETDEAKWYGERYWLAPAAISSSSVMEVEGK